MDYQIIVENGWNIDFKIETITDVTVISEQEYVSKRDGPLTQTNWVLSGPSQQKLDVCGQFSGKLPNQFNPLNKRFMLFVGFTKLYLANQSLKPTSGSKG